MHLDRISPGRALPGALLFLALSFATSAHAQPSFGARTDLAVGSLPRAVALADLNHDGHLDLVTACELESFVGIFLGNGDGTFGPRIEVPTDAGPRAIAVVDWNGDGEKDLLVSGSSVLRVACYLGHGDGTFTPGADVAIPGPATRLVTADLDGDGLLDFAAASDFGVTHLFVVRGTAGGGFGARTDLDSLGGSQSYDVAVGQFNGAGAPDLFLPLVCGTCPSRMFAGLGGGAFAAALDIPGLNRPHGAILLDYDGDGLTDVAVSEPGTTGTSGVRLLHSTGAGLVAGPLIPAGKGATGIALGPWGSPGESDIVVTSATFSAVSIVRVRCDGVAPSVLTTTVGGTPIDVAIGDVDEDGSADIVTANQGAGTVTIQRVLPSVSSYSCVRQADIAPLGLNFGLGAQGVASQLGVTLNSTGTVAATVTGASLSGDPVFQVLTPLPVSAGPGTSRGIVVQYDRTILGTHSGVLTLSTNDPLHPTFAIYLSGSTRVAIAVASMSPDTLKFGSDLVFNAQTMAVTVTNAGDDTLVLGSYTLVGSQFTYLGPPMPVHVWPGGSVPLGFRYSRTAIGPAVGAFRVTTNDAAHPELAATLTGTALSRTPIVQLDVTTLDFGADLLGNALTLPIVVRNAGNGSLAVSGVSTEGSEFSIVGSAGPVTLETGGSTSFSVRCARSVAGVATGVFHVISNDPATPDATVQLTAVTNHPPSITASAPLPGSAEVGASAIVPVIVRNAGPGPLTFTPSTFGTDLVETSGYDGPPESTPLLLTDAAGNTWDLCGNGSIGHGSTGEYAGAMALAVFPTLATAATGMLGREVRLGPVALPGGLQLTRKIYLPQAAGSARFAEVLENPGDTAVPYTVDLADTIAFPPADIPTTSSGNGSFTIDDTWLVFPPDGTPARRAPGRVSATTGAAHKPITSTYVETVLGAFSRVRYGVTVPPHGRAVVVSWEIQGTDVGDAAALASALASAPPSAFDGMAAIDRAATWNAPPVLPVFHTAGGARTVAPSDSAIVDVVCDAASANLPAHVAGTLRITSNDPAHPMISVPLAFEITSGATVGAGPLPGGDSAPARLALLGFVPNPVSSAGSPRIAYTLVSGAPATLTLYDLRGRVVERRALPDPSPGPGWIDLAGAAGLRLAPGVVWIRLEQGGRAITKKGIVLP